MFKSKHHSSLCQHVSVLQQPVTSWTVSIVLQLPDRCCVLPADEEPPVLHVCVDSILQCTSEEVLNGEGAAVPTSRAGWSRSGSCCHCGPTAGYACRRGPKRGVTFCLCCVLLAAFNSRILPTLHTSLGISPQARYIFCAYVGCLWLCTCHRCFIEQLVCLRNTLFKRPQARNRPFACCWLAICVQYFDSHSACSITTLTINSL